MDRSTRLLEGNIPRLLLTFSLPAIVGTMAQALYNIVDRIFLGQAVGPNGIAGTTIAFPFMLALMASATLIGLGAAAMVSIRLGEQNKGEAELVLGNATLLLVGVSLVLTAASLALLDPLLRLFGASDAVIPFARDYMWIIVLGSTFQNVGFGLNAVIRGEGNPRVAMVTMLAGVTLNVILAPVFIFGLGWGMKGAAIATVISQAVTALCVVAYFLSGRSLLRLRAGNLRIRWPLCATMVAIGSPPFALHLAASVSNSLLNHQLGYYGGDAAVSVMGIVFAVVIMILMPVFGINQGSQPVIGYNYGARRFDRVKKALQTAVLAATCIVVAGFSAVMLFPSQVIGLFDRDDAALAALGTHAIRICLAMLPIVGFQTVSANYFQAVGKPRQAIFLSLSRQVLLLIPAVLVLPHFFGLDGVWLALPAADLASSLLTAAWLAMEMRHLAARHSETLAAEPPVVAPATPS